MAQSMTFGEHLRLARVAAHLTQEELAERAGISARAVSDLERGVILTPRRDTVRLLAEALALQGEERVAFEALRRGPAAEPESPAARGVVTILIADLRGYTQYTLEQGDEAAARLTARFAAVVAEMVGARDGRVVEVRGDEALAVFSSPRQALRAAVELQSRFARDMAMDPTLPLRAGVGLDAGEAVPLQGGYRGAALNLAARLCALAGPGEVLTSETVISLARVIEGLTYVERGFSQLKGFAEPVRVIEVADSQRGLTAPSLSDVAVLTGEPLAMPWQMAPLPVPPTPVLGREREEAMIVHLLQQDAVRVLTLTGPGGVGKTRLALRVAEQMTAFCSDGVCWVSLAALRDPVLLGSTVLQALGGTETAQTTAEQTLLRVLRPRSLLLVLDNYEQLLPEVTLVATLLGACPRLTILNTSRAPLHLRGEQEYPVAPLAVPHEGQAENAERLLQYPAASLFVQRARAVKPTFVLTDALAPSVAELCRRLDGLPLALELAAARVKVLSMEALLHRLSNRLALLTGGARDLPTRQQTLRAAIAWSEELLDERARRLFRRLSVFAGGCTLAAVEAVCAEAGDDFILTEVTALVDQSLLQSVESAGVDEPRFVMLQTIHDYAWERLGASGEADAIRRHHAEYFLMVAEVAAPELEGGPQQIAWFERLDEELDNLRSAFQWAMERGEGELALRLATALREFWMTRSHLSEGRRWLEAALATTGPVANPGEGALRAQALTTAGWLAANQRDYQTAETLFDQSLALARQLGDTRRIIAVLGDLGQATRMQGDLQRAVVLYEESAALSRAIGELHGTAWAICNLGIIAHGQGDDVRAASLLEEGVAVSRAVGDKICQAWCLTFLARVAKDRGAYAQSRALFAETLALFRDVGHLDGLAFTVEGRAGLAVTQGRLRTAARLFGAAEAVREAIDSPQPPYERDLPTSFALRDAAAWQAAWAEGHALTIEQVLADDAAMLRVDGEALINLNG